MQSARNMTVGERIVLHLSQYTRHEDAYVCPPEMAQAGIARTLRISRAHAAIELKRQMDAGRILTRMAHVRGLPTRRKVYHLTPKGMGVAKGVRARARCAYVDLVLPGGERERVGGDRALELLRGQGVGEGRAVYLILTNDVVDLGNPVPESPVPGGRPSTPEARALQAFDRTFRRPYAWQSEVTRGPPFAPPVGVAA